MSRCPSELAGHHVGALHPPADRPGRRISQVIDQTETAPLHSVDPTGRMEMRAERVCDVASHATAGGLFAMVAHQLRTPLTSIRMQTELLLSSREANERRAYGAELLDGVDTLARLVDQFGDLATLQSLHNMHPAAQMTLLSDAYIDAMSNLQDLAAEKSLQVAAGLGGVRVAWHPAAVRVIVTNLLHNAFLYTPDCGTVQISATADVQGTVLTVDDSGPGIDPTQRAAAFERFERLGRDTGTGAGLGLSLVREAAALHGSTVMLAQSPLGGLRVQVHMPDSSAHAAQQSK